MRSFNKFKHHYRRGVATPLEHHNNKEVTFIYTMLHTLYRLSRGRQKAS
ncbi:MAG: hypothetical protein FWH29_08605 [Methanobrevibacter sp.]|nr:hypothetical protein [Methanobrevibacter sp.]